MNRYMIIGIVAIAIGTIMMTGLVNNPACMIFGGVINGLGLFIMTVGTLISSRKDKAEIMDRIRGFREEIGEVKKAIPEGESLDAVERIESEFSGWAESFVSNMDSKIVERHKGDILVREKEVNLSRHWGHVYKCFFETLYKMLSAYNQKTDNKIEFSIPDFPTNLFSEEARSFQSIISFDHGSAWAILLQIVRPYNKEELPQIIVFFHQSDSSIESAKKLAQSHARVTDDFLVLAANPYEEHIQTIMSSSTMLDCDIKDFYSIKPSDYKSAIRELLTTLIEYHLVSLVHKKSGRGYV